MGWFGLGFLLVLVYGLLTALSRAHEVFYLSIRGGRARIVRGALSADMLLTVENLLKGTAKDQVLIKGMVRENEFLLEVRGVSETRSRQLSSALEGQPLETLLSAPREKGWWRVLGFVWLEWWMHSRNQEAGDPPPGPPPRSNITPFRK